LSASLGAGEGSITFREEDNLSEDHFFEPKSIIIIIFISTPEKNSIKRFGVPEQMTLKSFLEVVADDFSLNQSTLTVNVKGKSFKSSFFELEESLNFSEILCDQKAPLFLLIEARNLEYPNEKSEFGMIEHIIDVHYNEPFRTPSKKKTKKRHVPLINITNNSLQRRGNRYLGI
jgi:hypothetical protein